ncbi:MAG TPA: cytochrome c [Blastocatellia bacterium]|nr:cytochrome c [Blastocatellia bacterium]
MSKRLIISLFAVSAIALAALTTGNAATAGDAAAGKALFGEKCASCHSATSKTAKVGPGLQGLYKGKMPASGKPVTDANVRNQILNGSGFMPGFKGSLSDEQIDNIIAYLHTI